MESLDPEFLKQLGGSGAANLLTIGLVGIFMLIKNGKCKLPKHSKCKGCCFEFEVDQKTLRSINTNGEKENSDERTIDIEDEEDMPELHGQHRKRLRKESV